MTPNTYRSIPDGGCLRKVLARITKECLLAYTCVGRESQIMWVFFDINER